MDYMTYVWIGLGIIALVAGATLMSKLDQRLLEKADQAERDELADMLHRQYDERGRDEEVLVRLTEPEHFIAGENLPKFDPVEAGATLVKKAKPKKAAAKKPVKQAAKKPARKRA